MADSAGSAGSTPRERLLDAARVVVARDGLEGLSLRAIAREAGVSHGAPLRHFPTLASLLAAMSAEGFEQLIASVSAEIAGVEEPVERITRAGVGYLRFAVAEPGVFSVMFRRELSDTNDEAYRAAGQASFDQLLALVRAAQEAGWRSEVATDRLAALLWADTHGLAELWLHGSLPTVLGVGDGADDLVALFLERRL
jgi:AcrR family transcriptional regulator